MRSWNSPRTRLIGIAVAATMVLAACSQSDTDDVADDASVDTTAAESQDLAPTDDGADSQADETTGEAAGGSEVASDYLDSYTLLDDEFGTMVTVTVDGNTRTIQSNAIPDHATGEFPNQGNPNTITEQDLTWEFTTEPTYVGNAGFARTSGVAVNGVKFEPGTGETVSCDSGENYRIEALQDIHDLGLDFNNAHVQPTGEYHYHGISQLLVEAYESSDDLVHVGFAADGFLMYYSKSGAYDSGYELSTEARSGTGCVASGPGGDSFDIEGSTPDGTYGSDWVFSEAAGDLDSCNGTTIDGQYAYIVTDSYPYISRCLNGEAAAEAGGGQAGAAPGGAQPGRAAPGGGGPDLAEAATALGVSEDELRAALGGPPADFEAASEVLGVTVEDLQAALAAAGGQAGPGQG